MGDLDLTYTEDGTRVSGAKSPSPNRDAIIAAVRATALNLLPGVQPTIEETESLDRFAQTTAPSLYGTSGSGRYLNLTLTFPNAQGGGEAKKLVIQLSERDSDWTPWQLVHTYWGSFMQVTVTARPGGGRLVGKRVPQSGTALVNVCNIISGLGHLPSEEFGKVVVGYYELLGQLLEKPWDTVDTNLKARHPSYAQLSTAEFDKAKEVQEVALMKSMPVFDTLASVPRDTRQKIHPSMQRAVSFLRKRE